VQWGVYWFVANKEVAILADYCWFSVHAWSVGILTLSASPKGGIMPDQKKSGFSDNSLGAIAYLTIVPALFFLAVSPYNKSAYVRFHAWQSTMLSVMAFILSFVLSFIPALSTSYVGALVVLGVFVLIWIVWVLVSLLCAIRALNGTRIKLPILGAWSEQQAKK
jgi:uncharacterized membrane protein